MMSHIPPVNSRSRSLRIYLNDFTGLGSASLAMSVLRAMESASPDVIYSYPSNPLSREPELVRLLNLQNVVGWHPDEWRRFDEHDWTAIASYLQFHRFDTIINFRNPDLAVDPRYANFKRWCSQEGIELRWYDCYGHPRVELVGRHIQERMVDLLRSAGIPIQPLRQDWLADSLPSEGVLPSLRLGIFPGANTLVKRWPIDSWYILATKILASTRCDLEVISGSSQEEQECATELYERLRELPGGIRVFLLQHSSLPVLVRSLKLLTILITNDTGVAHLANACRVRTLVLFLATESLVWGLRSDWALIVQSLVGRKCPLQRPFQGTCERHYDRCEAPCHDGILPEDVMHALDKLLECVIVRSENNVPGSQNRG